MKKGFGIIEVLLAAVVLGFLVVGLTQLQVGNRESILRVRARDTANFVAQNVLDSIGSVGLNSLVEIDENEPGVIYKNPEYIYNFDGKNVGKVEVKYDVRVELKESDEYKRIETTMFNSSEANATNVYNKKLEATVSWDFKKSKQSITMAKVVR